MRSGDRAYCILEGDLEGEHFCLWSIATNRHDCWEKFRYGIGDDSWSKKDAKKQKLKCVPIRIHRIQEASGDGH